MDNGRSISSPDCDTMQCRHSCIKSRASRSISFHLNAPRMMFSKTSFPQCPTLPQWPLIIILSFNSVASFGTHMFSFILYSASWSSTVLSGHFPFCCVPFNSSSIGAPIHYVLVMMVWKRLLYPHIQCCLTCSLLIILSIDPRTIVLSQLYTLSRGRS